MKKTVFISDGELVLGHGLGLNLTEKGIDRSLPYKRVYSHEDNGYFVTGEELQPIYQRPCGGFVATRYQKILSRAKRNKRSWG